MSQVEMFVWCIAAVAIIRFIAAQFGMIRKTDGHTTYNDGDGVDNGDCGGDSD